MKRWRARRERIIMAMLKSLLLCAIVSTAMLGNLAAATERPPRLGEEKIEAKKPAAEQTRKNAQTKKDEETKKAPPKRRAVRQVLDDDVRPSAAPPAVYAPQLTRPGMQPAPPLHGVPPPPANVNCVGAACNDASGGRYNGGVGTTLISPQGRLCNNNGMTVQCF
jgi:hypothetical protein